jgi:hypothetical protein
MQHLHEVRTFERTEGSSDVVCSRSPNAGLTTGLDALLGL